MFSVIIPLYNKEKYIKRSVLSVMNQSFAKFELLIVDDKSTDNSMQIVNQFNDSRIKIIKRNERGHGGYAARNLGIEKAKYQYVSFLDADDEWNENYLMEMQNLIINFPHISVFSCAWEEKAGKLTKTNSYYNQNKNKGSHIVTDFLDSSIKGQNPLCTIVLTVAKNKLTDIGAFPEDKCKRGGDIETWLRLMLDNKIAWTPYIGAIYNKNIQNAVTQKISDIEIPYVYFSVTKLIKHDMSIEKINKLKQYSNYYSKMSVLHSIILDKDRKKILTVFFKNVNVLYYYFFKGLLLFPPFLLKTLFKLYRQFMVKYSKSDIG